MNAKSTSALAIAALFLVVFLAVVVGHGTPALPVTAPLFSSAGAAMWKGRTFEVILQGIIILSGVISILLLLKSDTSREMPP